jgi:hypothetical protein
LKNESSPLGGQDLGGKLKMKTEQIDKMKIYKIVEYIKASRIAKPFNFECIEVEEALESILNYYTIDIVLTEKEKEIVRKELHKLSEEFEMSESLKLFYDNNEINSVFTGIETKYPTQYEVEILNKKIINELKAERGQKNGK